MELLKSQYTLPSKISQIDKIQTTQIKIFNINNIVFSANFITISLLLQQAYLVSEKTADAFAIVFSYQVLTQNFINYIAYINVDQYKIYSLLKCFTLIVVAQLLMYILFLSSINWIITSDSLQLFSYQIYVNLFYVFLYGIFFSGIRLISAVGVNIPISRLDIYSNLIFIVIVGSFKISYLSFQLFFAAQAIVMGFVLLVFIFQIKTIFLKETQSTVVYRHNKYLLLQHYVRGVIWNILEVYYIILYMLFSIPGNDSIHVQIIGYSAFFTIFYQRYNNISAFIDFFPFAFLNSCLSSLSTIISNVNVPEAVQLKIFYLSFLVQILQFLNYYFRSKFYPVVQIYIIIAVVIDRLAHPYDKFSTDTLMVLLACAFCSNFILWAALLIKQRKDLRKNQMLK
ncbi:Transmembrane domain-containing protein [Spironucleus salmonicida]|uniref:Transmembrane domain-containing protein n=1 Tax=Spironucleus salmonicida TaxID=348837 RepID=V6LS78_9EUKA|nr:Transmembrane domain-containing protein [Spironucleus salmonicida]|eukprot:EST47113.1 Transmembrane domain-containing protein [Spironucleus salmonicida]